MMEDNQAATLERPEDAGSGDEGLFKRWMLEIEQAQKTQKKWKDQAQGALERYHNEKAKANSFNILWANTEVIQPNVYNSKPRPDVRNRFPDKNPVAKTGAEVIERSLSFLMDDYDFDHTINLCVFDMLVPGRGVSRVRFKPYIENDEYVASVDIGCEHVLWDDFLHGPGRTWQEVTWIGYKHKLTSTQVDEKFPDLSGDIKLDYNVNDCNEKQADDNPEVFKRAIVWEIWDKDTRKIYYIHPGYNKGPLLVEDDKLGLRDFFDCPRPLMGIFSSDSLTPMVEYEMYKTHAMELDKVSTRINKLTDALKYRGIYDSSIDELKRIQSLEDGEFIPTQTSLVAQQSGGLDRAIWTQPIKEIADALMSLYTQREQIKGVIFEIMGLADIMRGSSDPSETLGAQELKAQTGSVRMRRRQTEVQRFVRDILRLKAEILAEQVPQNVLAMMTGMQIPTMEGKQIAQQALAMNPQNKEAARVVSMPSWEEIMQMMQQDAMRRFNIDIETDSTIASDQKADREEAVELINGIGSFGQNFGPMVQSGAISLEAAKKIMVAVIRKAKLGREVEEAMEESGDIQPQQSPQDIQAQMQQAEMQAKQQENQQKMQFEQQKMQAQQQADAARIQAEAQAREADRVAQAQTKAAELTLQEKMKMEEIASKERIERYKAELKHNETMQDIAAKSTSSVEVERVRSEASSKPAVALDMGNAMGEISQIMMTAVEEMKQSNQAVIEAAEQFSRPKVAKVTRTAKGLEGTIEPIGNA